MAMNKTQRDYAASKLSRIARNKISKITEEHGWQDEPLTAKDKYSLIKGGKVSLRSKSKITESRYRDVMLDDFYDFSGFEKKAGISKEGQEMVDQVQTNLDKAIDMVMLGDSQEALRIIEEFTKENK